METIKIPAPTMTEEKAIGLIKSRSTATSSGEGSFFSAAERGVTDKDTKNMIPIHTEINLFMNLIVIPHLHSRPTIHY
ncbi:MAG: hypothetical protein GTO13_17245 [Proteobacteria bacterium]|nr:hypothetical protein [Pseudomonadota bacterium]